MNTTRAFVFYTSKRLTRIYRNVSGIRFAKLLFFAQYFGLCINILCLLPSIKRLLAELVGSEIFEKNLRTRRKKP